MKKILIPTDLSDLGDYAYSIANVLAEKTGASITLLSIIAGPAGAYYEEDGKLKDDGAEDYSSYYENREKRLAELSNWAEGKTGIIATESIIGEVNDTIIRYSETNKFDLIIMGTEGLFGLNTLVKYSNTQYITNHSSIPVLSLKCNRENVSLDEVVFVSDFLEPGKLQLDVLKVIAKGFQSKIILLKVLLKRPKRTEDQIKADMAKFVEMNDLENVELVIYKGDTVEKAVSKFCQERSIDLVALGTHQKTGFSKLFRHSISDSFVNQLFNPVLTFVIEN